MIYKTEQEELWAGQFGADYIERNASDNLLASNLSFFANALRRAGKIGSCVEFGANIGMNLRALKLLYPEMNQRAVEINPQAAELLTKLLGQTQVFQGSIFDFRSELRSHLVLIKGVLIHINPEMLQQTYQTLYDASDKWVLVAEYYNPSPASIPYRGHVDRLFKRDFAGEMLDKFPQLELVDYGFSYRRDPAFPQDDITWFLMEKLA
jgi:pseudaminic acid biosynthesis-associated methylase